jgi:hypothetical protein
MFLPVRLTWVRPLELQLSDTDYGFFLGTDLQSLRFASPKRERYINRILFWPGQSGRFE